MITESKPMVSNKIHKSKVFKNFLNYIGSNYCSFIELYKSKIKMQNFLFIT